MANEIERLRKLQDVDGKLFHLRQELEQKPLVLERFREGVKEQQTNAQAIEARLKALQLQQKEKDIDLTTKETNTKRLQAQLFQVKTNKEYSAIQHEIDQSKADASLLEEEIIQLMEAVEKTAKEHKAQLATVEERQTELRRQEQIIAKELDAGRAQMSVLDEERQRITPLLEPATLSTYERILANREGLALVPLVSNEACGGCNMVQPPQVVHEVHLNARLVMCENCNRILYFDQYSESAQSARNS